LNKVRICWLIKILCTNNFMVISNKLDFGNRKDCRMKRLEYILKEELAQLNHVVEMAKQRLNHVPEGHLRVREWNGKTEYYYRNSESKDTNESRSNGRYLRKQEKVLAKSIAQRDYDTMVMNKAKERIYAIEKFLRTYERTSLKQLYQDTIPGRRKLIEAEIISDEEYIRQWQDVSYKGKSFDDEENEIITERGERVRSKSEKIIADKLHALRIPYRYEYPLTLVGGLRVYPDFTILKMPEKEEVYLEHFGMMDDADYAENALHKLNTFEKNKIYLGVNLFITHETSKNPLNTRALDGMLRKLFCEE